MSWGTISIGRMQLRENYNISHQRNASTGEITIQISGLEFTDIPRATPHTYQAALDDFRRRAEDIIGLADTMVPVLFSSKSNYNGFYRVFDTGAEVTDWTGEAASFAWNLILKSYGADNTVDIESRLGTVARANDFTLTGDRWHAPSIGHYGYNTGTTLPGGTTVRTGESGNISVYRGVPAVNPRWGCPVGSYMNGRVKLLVGGYERTGTALKMTATGWELNNGLLRITPVTNTLDIAAWSGGAWHSKVWGVFTDATALISQFDQATVIRNDPEVCTLRLLKDLMPVSTGIAVLDLTLRRGSRIVEGYFQRTTANELKLRLANAEAFTDNSASGYIVATGNDADGNRFAAGSARAFATHANGGVLKAATTTFDFWIGTVINGAAPASGDAALDLRNQYIGALAETTTVVRR